MRRLLSALVVQAAFAGTAWGITDQAAKTFTLDIGVHPVTQAADQFTYLDVRTKLENATGLFQHKGQYCNDVAVCIGLEGSLEDVGFGNSSDHLETIDDGDELQQAFLYDWIPFKVVHNIRVNQVFLRGANKADGEANACVAIYDGSTEVRSDTYAHEFGHMRGLEPNDDCGHYIMAELTTYQGYRDAVSLEEAEQLLADNPVYGAAGLTCALTGQAMLEGLVATAEADGVHIRFRTAWEIYTQSFEVRRVSASADSVLYSLPPVAGTGGGEGAGYDIVDPVGALGADYLLIEHQTPGRVDLSAGPIRARAPTQIVPVEPVTYDQDSLALLVMAYDDPEEAVVPEPCSAMPPAYAIVCPDEFAAFLGPYVSLWRDRNVDARIVTKSRADSCAGSIQNWIRWAGEHNTTYVLLVGDASDHIMWDDPTKWTNGWRYPMWHHCTGPGGCVPVAHLPSQPEKDVIPTFYSAVTDSPQVAWTFWTPYYPSDDPYSDLDDDGLPDLVVGRLPVTDGAQIIAYTAKLQTWMEAGNITGSQACLVTYAQNLNGSIAWPARITADSLVADFPSSVILDRITSVNWYTNDDSLANILSGRTDGDTDVITWISNWTARYTYGGFWDLNQGWTIQSLPPTSMPHISLALSCGMNNYDQRESYTSVAYNGVDPPQFNDPIEPIVERLLLSPDRGAIAQIGPTRGSQMFGNYFLGREILQRLYVSGTSLGRAYMMAKRWVMQNYPQYEELYRSYVLLGDPLIGAGMVITAAQNDSKPLMRAQLLPPTPNPSNPATVLRFVVPKATRISLAVYDLHGRRVRRLVWNESRQAGQFSVTWNGRGDQGTQVPSGVYFVRLDAGDEVDVRKITVLR